MASYLQWTDADGMVTFSNGFPSPGDRFNGWSPMTEAIGADDETLAAGFVEFWEHRIDYGARFRIDQISTEEQATALRLLRHLRRYGIVAVYTGDAFDHLYPTCQMWRGKPPELSDPDPQTMRRSLTVTLRNVAAEPEDMIAVYR